MSGGIRQCAHGHLSLDAANWVCPWCELARLEGLILDWDGGGESPSSDALYAEARRIRAQREEGR